MAAPIIRRAHRPSLTLIGGFFLLLLGGAGSVSAQAADLIYISNVSATHVDGRALTTIEDQTAATMDKLGEELRSRGLDYSDVVVSNLFLSDTRSFQGMNGVYRTYFKKNPPTRATVQADLLDPDAKIQISVVATRGPKDVITPAGLKSPELPYSWGFKVGNTLFISGATSRSPETYQPVPGDVATQTRRIFGNIGMVLEAAGMGFGDLVSCKVFLDDPRGFQTMNEAYAQVVPAGDPPARATVRSALMNALFSTEIQCVAEQTSSRDVIRIEGEAPRGLPFSPGIDTGERQYLAGVVGSGADVTEETQAAMERIGATLGAASKTFADVESVWVYLADIRDWDTVHGILKETMGEGMPLPTVVGSRLMGKAGVEIQVVAGG
jgi:2-iminobutanoate/2-iminopropanoate deaminase